MAPRPGEECGGTLSFALDGAPLPAETKLTNLFEALGEAAPPPVVLTPPIPVMLTPLIPVVLTRPPPSCPLAHKLAL